MTKQAHVISNSKFLQWLVKYAFSDQFTATLVGGHCCRHEIEQSFLKTEDSRANKSLVNFSDDYEAADLLIITGPVAKAQVESICEVYESMSQPKWVMVVGTCAISGGYLEHSPLVENSISCKLPVDIIVSGCPVRPADFLSGLIKLQKRIKSGELPRGLQ
jgi:NADH:ubiquinone oxidoreductase subunit B-like Fe-S oxidoreductase